MNNEYYILENGERIGPFTPRQLMDRPLEPGDTVLLPSQTQGVPAYSLAEFAEYFNSEGIYTPTQQNTSSYMLRFPAAVIDFFALFIPVYLLTKLLFPQYLLSLMPDMGNGTLSMQQMMERSTANMMKHQNEIFYIDVAFFFLTVLYNSFFESSHLRASLGKYAVGLAVVDELGYAINFWQALRRNLGKIIYEFASFFISLLAYVAYIRMIWGDKHQAFHDVMARCYVVKKNT